MTGIPPSTTRPARRDRAAAHTCCDRRCRKLDATWTTHCRATVRSEVGAELSCRSVRARTLRLDGPSSSMERECGQSVSRNGSTLERLCKERRVLERKIATRRNASAPLGFSLLELQEVLDASAHSQHIPCRRWPVPPQCGARPSSRNQPYELQRAKPRAPVSRAKSSKK